MACIFYNMPYVFSAVENGAKNKLRNNAATA